MTHVDGDAVPMMFLHGANDSLVPVEQARSMVDMVRKESSNPAVYVEYPGAQHAFDVFGSNRTIAAVDGVERFLNVVRGQSVEHVADARHPLRRAGCRSGPSWTQPTPSTQRAFSRGLGRAGRSPDVGRCGVGRGWRRLPVGGPQSDHRTGTRGAGRPRQGAAPWCAGRATARVVGMARVRRSAGALARERPVAA